MKWVHLSQTGHNREIGLFIVICVSTKTIIVYHFVIEMILSLNERVVHLIVFQDTIWIKSIKFQSIQEGFACIHQIYSEHFQFSMSKFTQLNKTKIHEFSNVQHKILLFQMRNKLISRKKNTFFFFAMKV